MIKLYTGGNIITMNGAERAEAVLTKDGKVLEAGALSRLTEICRTAERVDLKGRTMLPAFVDAHSHFFETAMSFLRADLEKAEDEKDITETIKSYILKNSVKPGEWVTGSGYGGDIDRLEESFADIFRDNPVIIQHKSGHSGIFNKKALSMLGADSKGSLFKEKEYFALMKKTPVPSAEKIKEAALKAQELYFSFGITFIQEGYTVKEQIPLYKELLDSGKIKAGIGAYSDCSDYDMWEKEFKNKYPDFILKGIKIFLDGSPQSRTAWLRSPYEGEKSYCGESTMTDGQVLKALNFAGERNIQVLAHCNGDRAAQQFIDCLDKALYKYPDLKKNRPVMIHAQFLGRDQLDDVKRLGIIPSFFIAHIYHFGDIHIKNTGFDRASGISCAGSCLKKGIAFTFHQDSPVIKPDMLETVECAVRRVTKNGILLGEREKISPMEALEAVTVKSAYQYGLENKKGVIKKGADADFVILEDDLTTVPHESIHGVKISQTVKGGETVYKA